jgi:hypothetical protein
MADSKMLNSIPVAHYASEVRGSVAEGHVKFDETSVFFHSDIVNWIKNWAGRNGLLFVVSPDLLAKLRIPPAPPVLKEVLADVDDIDRMIIETENEFKIKENNAKLKEFFAQNKGHREGFGKVAAEIISCLTVNGAAYSKIYPLMSMGYESEELYEKIMEQLDTFISNSATDIENFRRAIRSVDDKKGFHGMMAVINRHINLLKDMHSRSEGAEKDACNLSEHELRTWLAQSLTNPAMRPTKARIVQDKNYLFKDIVNDVYALYHAYPEWDTDYVKVCSGNVHAMTVTTTAKSKPSIVQKGCFNCGDVTHRVADCKSTRCGRCNVIFTSLDVRLKHECNRRKNDDNKKRDNSYLTGGGGGEKQQVGGSRPQKAMRTGFTSSKHANSEKKGLSERLKDYMKANNMDKPEFEDLRGKDFLSAVLSGSTSSSH